MTYIHKSAWAEPAENKTKDGQTHLENIKWAWVKGFFLSAASRDTKMIYRYVLNYNEVKRVLRNGFSIRFEIIFSMFLVFTGHC